MYNIMFYSQLIGYLKGFKLSKLITDKNRDMSVRFCFACATFLVKAIRIPQSCLDIGATETRFQQAVPLLNIGLSQLTTSYVPPRIESALRALVGAYRLPQGLRGLDNRGSISGIGGDFFSVTFSKPGWIPTHSPSSLS
jgi:hypothetical protein